MKPLVLDLNPKNTHFLDLGSSFFLLDTNADAKARQPNTLRDSNLVRHHVEVGKLICYVKN